MTTVDEKAMMDVWGQHLAAEFGMKNIEQVLATMGPNPCVNHVPLMTGSGSSIAPCLSWERRVRSRFISRPSRSTS